MENTGYVYDKSDIIVQWDKKTVIYTPQDESSLPGRLMHTEDHYEFYISHTITPINYYIQDKWYMLTQRDIVLLSPGITHCAFVGNGEICARTKIGIGPSVYSRFQEYLTSLVPQRENVWHISESQYQAVIAQLNRIEKAVFSETEDCELEIMLQVMLLWKQIVQYSRSSEQVEGQPFPPLLQQILLWIQEDNRFLTIKSNREVAEHFHISENYVPRLFHRYFPMSLIMLITSMKIQYAKTLLQAGKSVTEACYDSGFSDCSYFISTFKKVTGMTPGQYKKE